MTALIGDFVTTSAETYEEQRDAFGVPFYNKVGIRQGVVTGEFFDEFDTELSGLKCILYVVRGESGKKYGVKSLEDLTVVTNPPLNFIEDLEKKIFSLRMIGLLRDAYFEDREFPMEKDWLEVKQKYHDEFMKAHLKTGRKAANRNY